MNLVESIMSVKRSGKAPVLAEVKRLIPRLQELSGRPRDERRADLLARAYFQGGAAGISLVTERKYFGGEPERDIPAVLKAVPLPLLVKDFILNAAQIDCYFSLIAALDPAFLRRVTLLLHLHLAGEQARELLEQIYARGMGAMVEIRGAIDLPALNELDSRVAVELVGLNNKDIDELEKGEDRLRISPELVAAVRTASPRALIISQSAHRTPEDVAFSLAAGADGVLVGTAFMLAEDPCGKVHSFVNYNSGSCGAVTK